MNCNLNISFECNASSTRRVYIDLLLIGARIDNATVVKNCKNVAVWGWRPGRRLKKLKKNVLLLEHGYLGDRDEWISLGWNGLNGRANFYNSNVHGDRWEWYWKDKMKPWRGDSGDYALLCGQVSGDMSLSDCENYGGFLIKKSKQLLKKYGRVVYRPHPLAAGKRKVKIRFDPKVEIIDPKESTLEENISGAKIVVAWSSNCLVEAMYNGIPFESNSPFSMVHNYNTAEFEEPDRDDWGRKIAYSQWSRCELLDGTAWSHIKVGCHGYHQL
jgi:hypothetical protein